MSVRRELLAASDQVIDDAVKKADPMVLRGLLHQLTGDHRVCAIPLKKVMAGFFEAATPANDEDVVLLQHLAAEFLKTYRDAGAGPVAIGPRERLPVSLGLVAGGPIPEEDLGFYLEEFALDPWARSLQWRAAPDSKRVEGFKVTIVGAGMGGLNAAVHLKRAGIPFTMIEKNSGVGGTWYENRYPGARVDTPSRTYTHVYSADFSYPNPFCARGDNQKYLDWIADTFDLRKNILFDTEVRSLAWDETTAMWEIRFGGPEGERVLRSNAVITAVGFLNRPNMPELDGAAEFHGPAWHTARWPQEMDLRGKRVAVIGTGATGYQLIPELALEAEHVTVFQRTPQWLFAIPGYRSPFPPEVNWLDRNLPFHTNFLRFRYSFGPGFMKVTDIDPDFDDPYACSPSNKLARDASIAFLKRKLADADLVAKMTPPHPVWSARAIMVDPEYSILDAIQRDNVTLVTAGPKRINHAGIEAQDGSQHDVDAIVYATGFLASDYLFPMTISGRNGKTIEELWAADGARAYRGCMMPGFPNLWSLYGPNTNGALTVPGIHEMVTVYAMQCMEQLILDGKRTIEVTKEAYWQYNRVLDERNSRKVWSDPRAHNYYWTKHDRSAVQNPFGAPEMWRLLRQLDIADLDIR